MESSSAAATKIPSSTVENRSSLAPDPVPDSDPRPCLISAGNSPPGTSGSANPKSGKKNGLRESGAPLRNSVNRSVTQIRKHTLRKSASPLNWYPRKKADSFLQRKIKRLQEVGGMNLSLDETLCGANLHYSKIAREKIAATQAANRTMEARKAAMIEASWCRILKAARIHSKEAEEELEKAEKHLSEALEAAVALGIMMYDKPGSQRWPYEVETSLCKGGKSTHTITASFETAFEVEKEVAAAVKKAFLRLANCSSSNKDEFKNLLHKISENPDTEETREFADIPSKVNPGSQIADSLLCDESKRTGSPLEQRIHDSGSKSSRAFAELVDIMFDRLKQLNEDELSSLATIVATCGLNAALIENSSCKIQDPQSGFSGACDFSVASGSRLSLALKNRRYSIQGLMLGCLKREGAGTLSVGLDKCLVKHVSRLEREVLEARNIKKATLPDTETGDTLELSKQEDAQNRLVPSDEVVESVPGVEPVSLKHVSKLEKDIPAAKSELDEVSEGICESKMVSGSLLNKENEDKTGNFSGEVDRGNLAYPRNESSENLVVHSNEALNKEVSRQCLDTEKPDKENVELRGNLAGCKPPTAPRKEAQGKSNDINKLPSFRMHMSRIERSKREVAELFSVKNEQLGLDKILIKPKMEKTKKQLQEKLWDPVPKLERQKHEWEVRPHESLDKVLVRHVSRLEKEKLEALEANKGNIVPERRRGQDIEKKVASLDEILVKHPPRQEKSKLAWAWQPEDDIKKCSATRWELREREQQESWGGLSLGNSLKPSLSRLEREKAAWKKAEQEEKTRTMGI